MIKILKRLFTSFTIFGKELWLGFKWAEENRHKSMFGKF